MKSERIAAFGNHAEISSIEHFSIYFERMRPTLFRVAMKYFNHRESAEDALQTLFLKISKAISRGHSLHPETFDRYCNKSLRKVFLDACRYSECRVKELPITMDFPVIIPDFNSADGLVLLSEINKHIVANVKPQHLEIFILRHVDNLTYEEISSQLQITLPAVKSRLNKARQKIHQCVHVIH